MLNEQESSAFAPTEYRATASADRRFADAAFNKVLRFLIAKLTFLQKSDQWDRLHRANSFSSP